jgi:type VI secretion system secreted protein VgrG
MSHISLEILGNNQSKLTLYEMDYQEDYNGANLATLACVSEYSAIELSLLEGSTLFWEISYNGDQARQFGGVIQSITTQTAQQTMQDQYFYSIQLANPLTIEQLSKRSRIWMDKTVLQIIQAMFEDTMLLIDAKIDFSKCSHTYSKIDHIVQYDQSNYSFLQTLCANYGLYYYVTVDNTKTTPTLCVQFADDPMNYTQQTTSFALPSTETPNNTTLMYQLSYDRQIAPNDFKIADYNPADVECDLSFKRHTATTKDAPIGPISIFPANQQTRAALKQQLNNTVTSTTQNEQTFQFVTKNTQCSLGVIADTAYSTDPNHIHLPTTLLPIAIQHSAIDLSNLPYTTRQALALDDLSTDVAHSDFYQNQITAITYQIQAYLPPLDSKHVAMIPDYFSGIVAGKNFSIITNQHSDSQYEFKEIYPDALGRVRVYFPWDSNNPNKDYNLCPKVRVLTPQNGIAYAPHANDEVIIAAVNNRADRFVIIGSVYNSDHKPPLNIAANNALSGIKTANIHGEQPHYFYGDQTTNQERLVLKTSGDYYEFIGNCQDDTLCQHVKTIAQAYKQFVHGDMCITVEKKSLTISAKESIKFYVNGNLLELLPDSINIIGDQINLKTPDGHIGELVTKGKQVKYPLDTGTVKQGSGNVSFEGQPAARVDDLIKHGLVDDAIKSGNDGILINGKVAAVLKSPTNDHGQVSQGVSSVVAAVLTATDLETKKIDVPQWQPTTPIKSQPNPVAATPAKDSTLLPTTHKPTKPCTFEQFKLKCGHADRQFVLDVFNGKPTQGQDYVLQVIADDKTPDKVHVSIQGQCYQHPSAKAECAGFKVIGPKGIKKYCQSTDINILSNPNESMTHDFVGFFKEIFLPKSNPTIYMVESLSCIGKNIKTATIESFAPVEWDGEISVGYSYETHKDSNFNQNQGWKKLKVHGQWELDGSISVKRNSSTWKLGATGDKDGGHNKDHKLTKGIFDGMQNFLSDIAPFFGKVKGSCVDAKITWPNLKLKGNVSNVESAKSYQVGYGGNIGISLDPLIGLEVDVNIFNLLLETATGGLGAFLVRIKKYVAQKGVSVGGVNVKAELEAVFKATGQIGGDLTWQKQIDKDWQVSGDANGKVGLSLDGTIKADAQVFKLFSASASLEVGANSSIEVIYEAATSRSDTGDDSPAANMFLTFNGLVVYYSAYFDLKPKKNSKSTNGHRSSAPNNSSKDDTKTPDYKLSHKHKCILIKPKTWPEKKEHILLNTGGT